MCPTQLASLPPGGPLRLPHMLRLLLPPLGPLRLPHIQWLLLQPLGPNP